jgi:hypothetical protein
MGSISIEKQRSFKQLIQDVKKLSPVQKLKLNDVIWESDISIPEEHKTIVRERIKLADKDLIPKVHII